MEDLDDWSDLELLSESELTANTALTEVALEYVDRSDKSELRDYVTELALLLVAELGVIAEC